MIARVYARSLPLIRWSRDRIQNHFRRRFLKPRFSGFIVYLVVLVFIFAASFSSLGSFSAKSPHDEAFSPSDLGTEKKKPRSDSGGRLKRSVRDVVNPHNFHLMISNSRLCADAEEVNLLILVTSTATHFDQRQAIRSTWGQPLHLLQFKARLVFLLANPNNPKVQRRVVEEYRSFGDTIQEDFSESYLNLTLKTIMGVKWASNYCSKASFVLKTDDDIFVNVPLLVSHLNDFQREEPFFIGCIKQKNAFQPIKANSRAALPPAHPLFAAGAGYVFSGDLTQSLYEASLRTRIVPVEDVYVTGHLAKSIGVHPPKHDARFSCGEMVTDNCQMKQMFTGHKVHPKQMYEIWKIFDSKNKNKLCI